MTRRTFLRSLGFGICAVPVAAPIVLRTLATTAETPVASPVNALFSGELGVWEGVRLIENLEWATEGASAFRPFHDVLEGQERIVIRA